MKRQLLFLLAMCFAIVLSGQVVEKHMNMSAGEQAGLEVDLPVDSKTADKLWKEYVKPYGKTDWDRKNKEQVLFDVRISDITTDQLTIVARFNQYRDMTKGSFWFKTGDSFVNSDSDGEALRKAGEFLQQYAYETERYSIRQVLEGQEKEMRNLDKDMDKLKKKNQNLHKDIDKAKETIAKKEREIEENVREQKDKEKDIEKQKQKIKETTIKLTNVGKNT